MKIVNNIKDIDKSKWNAFVEKHPRGTVFQSYEMFEVYQNTTHNQPIAVAVMEDGRVLGVLLAAFMWNGNAVSKLFTARSIINGGPLALDDDETVLKLLLRGYRKALPLCTIYSEIRPVFCMDSMGCILKGEGFIRKGHYSLILCLKQNLDGLFDAMHKKRKREIKKSIEFGLEFKELQTQEEKRQAVELIKQTYRRKNVPLAYSDVLTQLNDYLGDYVRYFGAYIEDRIIASKIDLCFNYVVYAWFAGSDEKFFSYYPNDFLMWGLIKWAKKNGFEYLDFGGGGEPGVPYGVRDYKLQYGCQIFDYGRYQYFHRPLMYKIGEFGANLIMKK